ncbi:MAG TPA: hypothetical protein PKA19_00620 [Bacillota bacterium]|nr:hypothetical protein [Bacillota bacterium]
MGKVEIIDAWGRVIKNLSKGYRQSMGHLILEFTMKKSYLERVLQAEKSIKEGTAIEENW